MKRAIVTGATGFIGSYLIEELQHQGVEITAVVRPDSPRRKRLESNTKITVIPCESNDMLNLSSLLPADEYDVFFDLAWSGVAGNARADYRLQLSNVQSSLDAMQSAAKIGCSKFIGASSVSEYECNLFMPIDGIKVGGRFIYSSAKLASHYMHKCLAQSWGISYINANIANTFGENGLDGLLLHDTIIRLINGKPTSFSEGNQMYDFLYAADVASALYCLGERGQDFCSYYIGSDTPRPLKDYLIAVRDLVDPRADLGLGKRMSDGMDLPAEVFDNSKLKAHTGFSPAYTFEEGLVKTVEWYKSRLKIAEEEKL